jgi:hypothetical protein
MDKNMRQNSQSQTNHQRCPQIHSMMEWMGLFFIFDDDAFICDSTIDFSSENY